MKSPRVTPNVLEAIKWAAGYHIGKFVFFAVASLVGLFLAAMQVRQGWDHFTEQLHRSPEFIPFVVVGALFPFAAFMLVRRIWIGISPQRSRTARLLARIPVVRVDVTEVLTVKPQGSYISRNRVFATLASGNRLELLVVARRFEHDPTLVERTQALITDLR